MGLVGRRIRGSVVWGAAVGCLCACVGALVGWRLGEQMNNGRADADDCWPGGCEGRWIFGWLDDLCECGQVVDWWTAEGLRSE